MLKIISSLAIISALGLVACKNDVSSESVTQTFEVAAPPTFTDKHCFLRIRPVGQTGAPTNLLSFPKGSEDRMIFARNYARCTEYRPGDLIERTVRVSAN